MLWPASGQIRDDRGRGRLDTGRTLEDTPSYWERDLFLDERSLGLWKSVDWIRC